MSSNTLKEDFERMVHKVNEAPEPFAVDIMLKLYALYKVATQNQENPSGDKPYISAFKANALFQARHLDTEKAMEQYIEIAQKELK